LKPQRTIVQSLAPLAFALSSLASLGSARAGLITYDVIGGPLPASVVIGNDTPTNEFTQAIKFGTTISFDVTLSGPDVGGSSLSDGGDSFFFTLYNGSGASYSNSPSGAIVEIDVSGTNGTTTATAYPPVNSTGGPTATVLQPSAVPEPSSIVLALVVAGVLLGWHGFRGLGRSRMTAAAPAAG
jgi:hypothetical protein